MSADRKEAQGVNFGTLYVCLEVIDMKKIQQKR